LLKAGVVYDPKTMKTCQYCGSEFSPNNHRQLLCHECREIKLLIAREFYVSISGCSTGEGLKDPHDADDICENSGIYGNGSGLIKR
jgi:hypothetical protein